MRCPNCGCEISGDDVKPIIITTGEEFEQYLCERINACVGLSCEMTKASGDQGVELIVVGGGKKIAIQCKLYAGTVGNDAVQQVMAGRVYYGCDVACVVTNSTFHYRPIWTTVNSMTPHKASFLNESISYLLSV